MNPHRRWMWLAIAGGVAALVLGVGTTVLLATTGAFPGAPPPSAPGTSCTAPALAGQVVDITVGEMGPGMMGGPNWYTPGDGGGPGWHRMGGMYLVAHPDTVTAGTVSLRVVNTGTLTHEVIVLPLPAGQTAGERPTGPDGRIDETGSLGEASHSCGADAGDGITPGTTGWTTITLSPGRYELLCDFPGHYRAGMHTELDITP